MAPTEVRNPRTGVHGIVRSYDPKKRIIRLTNRVTVLDQNCDWEYYNVLNESWFKCFKKK